MERFTRLEVDRAVLRLQDDVGAEFAVERLEFVKGLFGSVFLRRRIDESAPKYGAVMRRERIGEHVRAVRVRSAVGLRPWLSFGIGLDEKTAEIGNQTVDFIGLGIPPEANRRVERVRGCEPANLL